MNHSGLEFPHDIANFARFAVLNRFEQHHVDAIGCHHHLMHFIRPHVELGIMQCILENDEHFSAPHDSLLNSSSTSAVCVRSK